MKQSVVSIRGEVKPILEKLSHKKKVSQQGLLTALIMMADGDNSYGIVDIDWEALRENFPTSSEKNKSRWDKLVEAVRQLKRETDDPEEIAMRSRYTIKQVNRALEQLGATQRKRPRRRSK